MTSISPASASYGDSTPRASLASARAGRHRSLLPDAYGLLFGAMPVLSIAASNGGEYALGDLVLLVCMALAVFGLIYLVARVIWRRSPETAGLATALAAFWTWCYINVQTWLVKTIDRPVSSKLLLPVCALATLGILSALNRVPRVRGRIASMARVTSILVVCWLIVSITRQRIAEAASVKESAFIHALAAPIPIRPAGADARGIGVPAAGSSRTRPDIYVIILDQYGGERALREFLDIDNRPFEDSLRALGFVVPQRVIPNYTQTILSLPSFLNMTLLTPLTREVDVEAKNTAPLFKLIEHNRALRLAKAAGYHVVGFPPAWWPGTSRLADADEMFNAEPVSRVRLWAGATQFRQAIWKRSILGVMSTDVGAIIPEVTLASAKGIEHLAQNPAPTFAFAHFLLPHNPYELDADCNVIPSRERAYSREDHRPGYRNQLHCANKLVLGITRELLSRSATPPVIIFQGDHGTSVTDAQHETGRPSAAQLRERFDTFGAYYLPGDSATALRGSVSLVNVLRHVFSRYVGADLPPLADTAFYSSVARPYKFTPVDTASVFNR